MTIEERIGRATLWLLILRIGTSWLAPRIRGSMARMGRPGPIAIPDDGGSFGPAGPLGTSTGISRGRGPDASAPMASGRAAPARPGAGIR